MINLDDYINRVVKFTINGEVVSVKEPSNSLFGKIAAFEKIQDEDKIFEAQRALVCEILNRNQEGRQFKESDIAEFPQGVLNRILRETTALTHKALNDPN